MKQFFTTLLLLIACFGFTQEICDNAIDDDGDGLIDLNDPECDCFEAVPFYIPNPSFEDTLCCPDELSELTCAESWIQASIPTSDYFHTCGIMNLPLFTPPPFPLPGDPGDEAYCGIFAYDSSWSEYVGTCLESPLLAGTTYILTFWVEYAGGSEEFDATLYGTSNCADLPWVGTNCPIGHGDWATYGHQIVDFVAEIDEWKLVTIEFVPLVDLNAIAVGGPCWDFPSFTLNYYYVDELDLVDTMGYFELTHEGGFCSDDMILTGHTDLTGGDWQWYKDGIALIGETGTTLEVTPYGTGTYTVSYTIGDFCIQDSYTTAHEVEVDFIPDNVCEFQVAEFENSSTGVEPGEITWNWDFGDGATSTAESPTHLYPFTGPYDVTLLAISIDSSCNDTMTKTIFVSPTPHADFEFTSEGMYYVGDDLVVCRNQEVEFTDLSTSPYPSEIVDWSWSFSGLATSDLQNPTYTFPGTGTYFIVLWVETDSGCADPAVYLNLRVAGLNPNFTVDDYCVGEEAIFTNTSTFTGPGSFDSWIWDFGDGLNAYTEDAAHAYLAPGEYTVELIGMTASGCADSIEHTLIINDNPIVDFDFEVDGVAASAGGTGGCYTSEVFFTDLSTVIPPTFITEWAWDFGDGFTSSLPNPSHIYASEGTYTVTLQVYTEIGCTNTFTREITMTNGLAYLSADTTICENGEVHLHAESSDGSFFYYNWSIPGTDTDPDQVITGLTEDTWIYVTATNEAGCISPMDSVYITILDPITLEITPFDTICLGDDVITTVMPEGGRGDYHYEWTANGLSLGMDMASITTSPTITTEYCVTVSDGCETSPVTICTQTYVPEVVTFTADKLEGCEPTEITFTSATGPDPALNSFVWQMNGTTLFGNPVAYTFEEAGTYTIKLTVISPEGCSTVGSVNDFITIHPLPTPEFYATPNPTSFFNTRIKLVATGVNPTSYYEWLAPYGAPDWVGGESSTEVFFPELTIGEYTVYLIETTEFGCVDTTQSEIIINNDQLIYAPNTFTPDGDQYNDTWGVIIEGIDIYDFHLTIFNRWGEIIWESYNPGARWNGTYGGEVVQDGIYIWVLQAGDSQTDQIYEYSGTVNVLR